MIYIIKKYILNSLKDDCDILLLLFFDIYIYIIFFNIKLHIIEKNVILIIKKNNLYFKNI